jgi:hypothetical protein
LVVGEVTLRRVRDTRTTRRHANWMIVLRRGADGRDGTRERRGADEHAPSRAVASGPAMATLDSASAVGNMARALGEIVRHA